jgi:hypothetical protein
MTSSSRIDPASGMATLCARPLSTITTNPKISSAGCLRNVRTDWTGDRGVDHVVITDVIAPEIARRMAGATNARV